MKVVAVIPARYDSSRFKGKPLELIKGKPMIAWVYGQVSFSSKINEVYVATDDIRIEKVCKEYNINVIMTSKNHDSSTSRVQEVSEKVKADLYVVVNGDEPLIDFKLVEKVIPKKEIDYSQIYVANLMTKIHNPVEAVDFTNIKVTIDKNNNALFFSRSPIPYPKASMDYDYYKHVGILIYNKLALDFFVTTPKGLYEKIEDINELRFIEAGIKLKMIKVNARSLSVDTKKDLERVRKIVDEKGLECKI